MRWRSPSRVGTKALARRPCQTIGTLRPARSTWIWFFTVIPVSVNNTADVERRCNRRSPLPRGAAAAGPSAYDREQSPVHSCQHRALCEQCSLIVANARFNSHSLGFSRDFTASVCRLVQPGIDAARRGSGGAPTRRREVAASRVPGARDRRLAALPGDRRRPRRAPNRARTEWVPGGRRPGPGRVGVDNAAVRLLGHRADDHVHVPKRRDTQPHRGRGPVADPGGGDQRAGPRRTGRSAGGQARSRARAAPSPARSTSQRSRPPTARAGTGRCR